MKEKRVIWACEDCAKERGLEKQGMLSKESNWTVCDFCRRRVRLRLWLGVGHPLIHRRLTLPYFNAGG